MEDSKIVKCNHCGGSGNEPTPVAATVFTLGLAWLVESLDPDPCEKCNGTGYIMLTRCMLKQVRI